MAPWFRDNELILACDVRSTAGGLMVDHFDGTLKIVVASVPFRKQWLTNVACPIKRCSHTEVLAAVCKLLDSNYIH